MALRTFRARRRGRPAVQRHRDDEVGQLLLVRGTDRAPGKGRRTVDRGGERLVPGRVEDDPDRRPPVDDQPDRDAEERDAVGVVDRAVERVDDPDPATPRGGRLARHRAMLAGLLGEDRVVREARPDRVEDQRLGQVVGLGDHVPGALVVDPLEPLVAVHEDRPGELRELGGEGQLGGVRQRRGGRSVRHGPEQSISRGRTADPSTVTCWLNVRVSPAVDLGREDERARIAGAIRRIGHLARRLAPAAALVGDGQRERQPTLSATGGAMAASNGPMPARANWRPRPGRRRRGRPPRSRCRGPASSTRRGDRAGCTARTARRRSARARRSGRTDGSARA